MLTVDALKNSLMLDYTERKCLNNLIVRGAVWQQLTIQMNDIAVSLKFHAHFFRFLLEINGNHHLLKLFEF